MNFKITRVKKPHYFSLRLSIQMVSLMILYVIFLAAGFLGVSWYCSNEFNMNLPQLENFSQYRFLLTGICSVVTILFFSLELIFVFLPIRRLETMFISYQKDTNVFENNDVTQLDKAFQAILDQQKSTLEKTHEAELLRKDTELSALLSQINPHFLYNTLDSIRGFSVLHNMNEIADLTESLSTLFRNVINRTNECIFLEDELKNISYYMTIQQFRFNNKFQLKQKIESQNLLKHKVLNLTLQPIVENAIFHGLENKIGNGEIIISVYSTEKRMIITVSDNGVGIEPEKVNELNDTFVNTQHPIADSQSTYSGIALSNVNQRIKLHFGDNYGLKILSTVGIGTDVEVVLPLICDEVEDDLVSFEDNEDA